MLGEELVAFMACRALRARAAVGMGPRFLSLAAISTAVAVSFTVVVLVIVRV